MQYYAQSASPTRKHSTVDRRGALARVKRGEQALDGGAAHARVDVARRHRQQLPGDALYEGVHRRQRPRLVLPPVWRLLPCRFISQLPARTNKFVIVTSNADFKFSRSRALMLCGSVAQALAVRCAW